MKISNLTRIYFEESIIKDHDIIIDGDNFYHLKSVMRLRLGDYIRVFNGKDGEFLSKITNISRDSLEILPESFLRPASDEKNLTLAMCIIKQDRMIEAIRASVQLGVTKIIPIISERTQYKKISHQKIHKVIISAIEQSERFSPPELSEEMKLSDFCAENELDQIIFANESESQNDSNKIKNLSNIKDNIAILIGPEGGFSDEEVDTLKQSKNTDSVSLGPTILRAETAVISTIACVAMMRNG